MVLADQIVLKDGTTYSGKFVRGDSRSVDFRILGNTENFQISDVAQILFQDSVTGTPAPTQSISSSVPEPIPSAAQTMPTPEEPVAGSWDDMDSTATLPEGTPIIVRTLTAIDTDRNRVGDIFEATLEEPLTWGNYTVAPRGSKVKGRIAYAKESGKLTGRSQLLLELTELIVNGRSYFPRTTDYVEEGVSRGKKTAATVGGVAALGAIIGAIAGGGKGAAIGAASGAAAGTGVQVLTRGEVLKIPVETILEFKLQSPLAVDLP